jgi:hypothetical protein
LVCTQLTDINQLTRILTFLPESTTVLRIEELKTPNINIIQNLPNLETIYFKNCMELKNISDMKFNKLKKIWVINCQNILIEKDKLALKGIQVENYFE